MHPLSVLSALTLVADLLPDSSTYYGVMMGISFFLGVYAHAAKMPRLVAFSIVLVFATTVLTFVAARTFDGTPGAELP